MEVFVRNATSRLHQRVEVQVDNGPGEDEGSERTAIFHWHVSVSIDTQDLDPGHRGLDSVIFWMLPVLVQLADSEVYEFNCRGEPRAFIIDEVQRETGFAPEIPSCVDNFEPFEVGEVRRVPKAGEVE